MKIHGFCFAALYMAVKEYSLALIHIRNYIEFADNSAVAYKMLGHCLKLLDFPPNDQHKAFERSLELDPNQIDLITEIGGILLKTNATTVKAKEWCDFAEQRVLSLLSVIDDVKNCLINGQSTPSRNIIGHVLGDGSIQNKDGNITSFEQYINTLTPLKAPLTAAKFFGSFTENSPDFISSSSDPSQTACMNPITELMYENPLPEPDSTTECTSQVDEDGCKLKDEQVNSHLRPQTRRVPRKTKKSVQCPILGCASVFAHRRNIKRHIQTFHGQKLENGEYAIVRWKCNKCNKSNLNENNYIRHYAERHEKTDPELKCLDANKLKVTYIVPAPIYKS